MNFFAHFDSTEWLLFHEKVTTSKAYLRDTTGVPSVPLLLFGDDLSINHKKGTVNVGPWIEIKATPETAVMLKLLREKLQQVLVAKVENPSIDIGESGQMIIDTLLQLVR